MGKVVKIAAAVVGVAINVIPGVGQAISGAIFGALAGTATVGAFAAAAFTFSQVVTMGLAVGGLSAAMGFVSKAVGLGPKPPKQSLAATDRLRANLEPRTFRKIVFGHTAAAVDVRYQEFTGADQEYLNSIIVHSSHQLQEIEQIWFDEKLAWAADGGVNGEFAGYLGVEVREYGFVGGSFGIPSSTSWTAEHSRFIGCGYSWLRYKRTGNTKKAESPFASNITSRITVRVKGALMYDPRLDSTRGGSGGHRAEDQTTWAWVSDDVGRNPALHLLWYLLGWRIQDPTTMTWRLAVGLGLPVERIDIDSFIAAANLCDEPVALAAGGFEPRYRNDGVFSEGDDPSLVFENLLAAMNGVLRDAGGRLSLAVLHNDLAVPIVDLTEADVIGDFTWLQTPPIDQSFNYVAVRNIDASNTGLYQFAPEFIVALESPDGIDRPGPSMDLATVQSPGQAQRLAKQYLQRAQYPGTFSATFLASAWRCEVGSVISLTFPALGFDDKLFRVVEHSISLDGTCPMVLREEHASIYAWDSEENPSVTAALPVSYDPLNEPWVQAIGETDEDVESLQDQITALSSDFNTGNNRNGDPIDAPTFSGTPGTALSHTSNDNGSVNLKLSWIPIADPEVADGTQIGFRRNATTETFTPGSTDENVTYYAIPDPARSSITHAGVQPTDYYTPFARYYRRVDLDIDPSGFIYSAWAKPAAAPYRPSSSTAIGAGGTVNIDGVAAASIAGAVTNFNADNDANGLTPNAASSVALSSVLYPDSTALDIVTWSHSNSATPGNADNIDGYLVGLMARSSSSGYTYNPADDALIRWKEVRADLPKSVRFEGVPSSWYRTAIVKPFRRVRTDVATSGLITASAAQSSSSSPHNSNDAPNFTGKLDSVAVGSVVNWAGRAGTGLNSDGTVAAGMVDKDAIVAAAINATDWVSQGADIAISESDFVEAEFLTLTSRGKNLRVMFLVDYQFSCDSPTHGEEFLALVYIQLKRLSDSAYITPDPAVIGERWDPPTAAGTKTFGRKTLPMVYDFESIDVGETYDIGYRVETGSNAVVTLRRYRYLRAEDKGADD